MVGNQTLDAIAQALFHSGVPLSHSVERTNEHGSACGVCGRHVEPGWRCRHEYPGDPGAYSELED